MSGFQAVNITKAELVKVLQALPYVNDAYINPDDNQVYVITNGDPDDLNSCMKLEALLTSILEPIGLRVIQSNDCEGCFNECIVG